MVQQFLKILRDSKTVSYHRILMVDSSTQDMLVSSSACPSVTHNVEWAFKTSGPFLTEVLLGPKMKCEV